MTLCNLPSFTGAKSALNSGGWDGVFVMRHKHLIFHLHWLFESTPPAPPPPKRFEGGEVGDGGKRIQKLEEKRGPISPSGIDTPKASTVT